MRRLVAALCALASGCGWEPPPPAEYVGSAACFDCHQKETELWRGSHHDLAMQPATEESVLGDFSGVTFTHFGVTSTFSRRGGRFLVETDGPDGALHEYEIKYAFGVTPLQQYLVEFPRGRLQTLGICWDTRPREEGGQRWFHIYPDEPVPHDDPLHWTGLNQNWNFMCAECHSTNLRKRYDVEQDAYRTSWNDIDVGCEACHGPGSRHVAWGKEPARRRSQDDGLVLRLDVEDTETWFFSQKDATAQRRMPLQSNTLVETCARCHSRRGVLTEDYVFGRPLMDTHRPSLLLEPLYFPDGQIRDEVYVYASFLQSKMHHRGVTCSSCHDAHSLRLKAQGNELCNRCHQPEKYDVAEHHFHEMGTKAALCVECHMPTRTYMVVDPRRDHSFKVPRPDLSAEVGVPNVCNGCHADKSVQWSVDKVVEWYGKERRSGSDWARAIHAGQRMQADAPAALRALVRDRQVPGIVRASGLFLLRQWPDPETIGVAVAAAANDPDPIVRQAAVPVLGALPAEPRLQTLARLLRDPVRGVRVDAAQALAGLPFAAFSASDRAAFEPALAEYVTSEVINGDRPQSQVNLGALYARQGRVRDAEQAYLRALRIAPYFVVARVNLADLYREMNDEAAGEKVLREGIELAPTAAILHHSLGLVLARQKRTAEALEPLRRAAELDRDDPRFAYVYAVALHGSGKVAGALQLLDEAHRRHPADRDLLVALTTMHRDAGNREQAVVFARKLLRLAPADGEARRLLQSLTGQAR